MHTSLRSWIFATYYMRSSLLQLMRDHLACCGSTSTVANTSQEDENHIVNDYYIFLLSLYESFCVDVSVFLMLLFDFSMYAMI